MPTSPSARPPVKRSRKPQPRTARLMQVGAAQVLALTTGKATVFYTSLSSTAPPASPVPPASAVAVLVCGDDPAQLRRWLRCRRVSESSCVAIPPGRLAVSRRRVSPLWEEWASETPVGPCVCLRPNLLASGISRATLLTSRRGASLLQSCRWMAGSSTLCRLLPFVSHPRNLLALAPPSATLRPQPAACASLQRGDKKGRRSAGFSQLQCAACRPGPRHAGVSRPRAVAGR
jgi:hypothetical protein